MAAVMQMVPAGSLRERSHRYVACCQAQSSAAVGGYPTQRLLSLVPLRQLHGNDHHLPVLSEPERCWLLADRNLCATTRQASPARHATVYE